MIKHKFIIFLVIIVIAGGGYYAYEKMRKDGGETVQYITSKVRRDLLSTSISGTGQVSTSNQSEIKPKASGNIVYLNASSGQKVKMGELIAQIDSRNALSNLNEAKANLEMAELELQELLEPVDEYTLLQAENSLANAEDDLVKLKFDHENEYNDTINKKASSEDDLEKEYEDVFNEISNAFLDLPDITTGLYAILHSNEIVNSGVASGSNNYTALINSINSDDWAEKDALQRYIDTAKNNYGKAKDEYNENFEEYKDITRYSEKNIIEDVLDQTLKTCRTVADAVKSQSNMLDYWVEYRTEKNLNIFSLVSQYQASLDSHTSTINGDITSLLSEQTMIEGYKTDIEDAEDDFVKMEKDHPLEIKQLERSIEEKKQKIEDLGVGATDLEIKNKELSIQQRKNTLTEAQQNYADYFVRVPFDGVIAEVNSAKGDSVSNSTVIATLISDQKIAEITLNEIDASKIEVGQKVILEFDAVEDLTMTGRVAELDILGEVYQGVVSYNVKIVFDVQDERIKHGMSLSASIILESKPNILIVPISALKTVGDNTYVEILVDGKPQMREVVTGLSDDVTIEISEGLLEGEDVIIQTISNGNNNPGINSSGMNMGGGGSGQSRNAMRGVMRIMH